ncbi:polysaccharide biosynthesis tyrosine autokinase [Gordonia amicalis]|uniref:polysaccharide biosynthesis tyrosine autokinase n=1 Tax=Gordonia amicalis TaxID=89053 RepID=UPI0022B5CB4D|nr:polysaccharide biosynthesis tyrosine autokinase [Gordonia amicalis]MCZ4581842.1 polysaccharide biosynthesis tyrosine autokinase [Gordonia amicalis]
MKLSSLAKVLKDGWYLIVVTALVAACAGLALSLMSTPLYSASARLFVSTSSNEGSTTDLYQGNLYSQQRVASYTQILTGEALASRTVRRLGINVDADELRSNVSATASPGTVLIRVSVRDDDPSEAARLANAVSDEFVDFVSELDGKQNASSGRVVVEQYATASATPVSPRTGRNALLALIFGALVGLAIVIVRDRLNLALKSESDIADAADSKVLGRVPFDPALRATQHVGANSFDHTTLEAFRSLRTNLQYVRVDRPPRVVSVTSSVPEEGKSTVSIGLASVLAEGGSSVCLVDADMRLPSVAEYLGVSRDIGLSTVLAGQLSWEDAIQDSQVHGIRVLASGPPPPDPSELLGSGRAVELFRSLSEAFDYVVVDSPPLLAVTDPCLVSLLSDGALMVARFGRVTEAQLKRSAGELESVRASLLGVVVTMVPRNSSEYGVYYSYSSADASHETSKLTAQ